MFISRDFSLSSLSREDSLEYLSWWRITQRICRRSSPGGSSFGGSLGWLVVVPTQRLLGAAVRSAVLSAAEDFSVDRFSAVDVS